ncbi:MAG: hypothetical protein JW795_18470 [Chitinivibrionales bacterium]|nr:hypothetical protein [Chitinivibrionales bacterium]
MRLYHGFERGSCPSPTQAMIARKRFFTVVETCAHQARSIYKFIRDSIASYCVGISEPYLIPAINSAYRIPSSTDHFCEQIMIMPR